MGRDERELQFRPGDLVEVFRGDRVSLEIVCSLPIDRTDVEKRILSSNIRPPFDFTDDGYTTLDGDDGYMECHSHLLIVQCFPANTLTLNDAQKEVLLNGYQNFLQNK